MCYHHLKAKFGISVGFMVLVVFMLTGGLERGSFDSLYAGAPFYCPTMTEFFCFCLFTIFTMALSFLSDNYIREYGRFLSIRAGNRRVLTKKVVKYVCFTVLSLEVIRMTIYISIFLLRGQGFDWTTDNIGVLVTLSLLGTMGFLLFQEIIEMKSSGSTALAVVSLLFFVQLVAGKQGKSFFLLNYMPINFVFSARRIELIQKGIICLPMMYLILTAIVILELVVLHKVIQNKDIL